ncbi:TetR/AcrR family transcriptional regulator [Methylocapsa sp. S129]|uniref:TetR/AcrR family transcriptional regulator n=1 Tax=Methylocapsa sp. S129 TaxID=1641869 RepID=UPI00131DF8E4|nr:TetR/AcrR family transcriptional regulator [Methylocapsa sp. S129]
MSRTESRLSRQKIAAAALAIADKEGFEAASMRRVAQELKVGTMSLYYYVKTKDDLIAAMDDALMGEALLPSLPRDWRRAMMEIAKRTHAVFIRHPWALVAMLSAPPGLNAMRHIEQCFEALAETSMTTQQKMTLLATVDDFVFGHALRAAAADATIDAEFAAAQLATGAFPRLAAAFGGGRVEANKDRFERGLRALLDAGVNEAS